MPAQTQILTRRGAAATWTSTNPTLGAGEIGYETDTGKFKIGTGAATWTSLGYFNQDPVTTKGDLYTFSTTDARLAVGNDGETLVADSSATTGLSWQGNYAAGKNKVINGDFAINQRVFTSTITQSFGFDRWQLILSGGTATYSAQTFTPGAAPVAGYESKNFARLSATTGNDFLRLRQAIEDARTLAGQTATISFWAKGTNPTTPGNLAVFVSQNFGSGGSPSSSVNTSVGDFVLTGSWTRYSLTVAIPSVSGKTFGTTGDSRLEVWIGQGSSISTDSWELDLWGVQLEAGSVATPFQTATGTIQGELAACQRYYVRFDAGASNFNPITMSGQAGATTAISSTFQYPVTMRVGPTSVDFANLSVYGGGSGFTPGFLSVSSLTLTRASTAIAELSAAVVGATNGAFYRIQPNSAAGYVGLNAEL